MYQNIQEKNVGKNYLSFLENESKKSPRILEHKVWCKYGRHWLRSQVPSSISSSVGTRIFYLFVTVETT